MIYKIVVDKQPRENPSIEKRTYEVDIEELRTYRGVCDSLVIAIDGDYVMRRVAINELRAMSILPAPIKQPLEDIDIELFEGDNYIYLIDVAGEKLYAEYLVKNEFNQLYVTKSEMNSAINQSATAIELVVNGKFENVDGEIRDINAGLELKVDKDDNDQVISMINASADEINLTSNRLSIDSDNFKLTKEGDITANSGDIGGLSLSPNGFVANVVSKKIKQYTYTEEDIERIKKIITEKITPTSEDYDKYDFNYSGDIDILDWLIVLKIINKTETGEATLLINSSNSENLFQIIRKSNETAVVSLGLFSSFINSLTVGNLFANSTMYVNSIVGNNYEDTDDGFMITPWGIDDKETVGFALFHDEGEQTDYTIFCRADTGRIECKSLVQTSREKDKKNFEKLTGEEALKIIKDTDIYKYNMKFEDDNKKKHIGFVIGDNYKHSKSITAEDEDGKEIGVDSYSMISVAYKVIQKQQEKIEELEQRINKLEKGDN